jgi:hypothetical protein
MFKNWIWLPYKVAIAVLSFVVGILAGAVKLGKDVGAGLAHVGLTSLSNVVDHLDQEIAKFVEDLQSVITDLKKEA